MDLNFEAFPWQRQMAAPGSQLFFQGPGLAFEVIRTVLLKGLQVRKLPAQRRQFRSMRTLQQGPIGLGARKSDQELTLVVG